MANKLEIYNAALNECGKRRLTSLAENGESRRVLDEHYSNVVYDCLQEGSWNFAMETVKLVADTGVTPNFGDFTEIFAKPSDWSHTVEVSTDESFTNILTQYDDDENYWAASTSPIYVRYVSNDTGMGFDLDRWPRKFTRYVELELASRSCYRLTQSASREEKVEKRRDKARTSAKNTDAMNEKQPKFKPPGGWTTARRGRQHGHERGLTSQFTGG